MHLAEPRDGARQPLLHPHLGLWGTARGRHVVGYLVWAAVGMATAVVVLWRHDTASEVASTFLVASLVGAVVGVAVSVPRRANSDPAPH